MSLFSERLKILRLERGENQSDVAELLGVSVQSYSAYEGSREPKFDFVCKLAQHYNVSTDYLLGLSDCSTQTREDIRKTTGLSAMALNRLIEWNNSEGTFSSFQKLQIEFINEIIETFYARMIFDYDFLVRVRRLPDDTPEEWVCNDENGEYTDLGLKILEMEKLAKNNGLTILGKKDAIKFYASQIAQNIEKNLIERE